MYQSVFPKLTQKAPKIEAKPRQPARLGDILVENGQIGPNTLAKALALQNHEEAQLGQILMVNNEINSDDLGSALAQQHQMAFENIDTQIDPALYALPFSARVMLEHSFVPLSLRKNTVEIATCTPHSINMICELCEKFGLTPRFALASRPKIHNRIASLAEHDLACLAENACPEERSCRRFFLLERRLMALACIFATLFAFFGIGILPEVTFTLILLIFLGNSLLKFTCLLAALRAPPPPVPVAKFPKKLEKVSILVPLLHEKEIVGRLIPRLEKINYPKELLEICLICEASDSITRTAIDQATLPPHFRVMVTPKGSIETKPRALNYAMEFCNGSIIAVYDAEDAPETDQVFKAVKHLQHCDPRVVCVQARLDFFNQSTNWLSRCFTIEYAMLFRVVLRGLQRLDIPIPLGGTSMFLRKSALDSLGRWDAHNVTEDADLGIRIYRAGLRVECLDSTTYEEANYRFIPWVKQRSRWLKGFFMTWVTHMRRPLQLHRDLGLKGAIGFHILLLNTLLTYLAIPFALPLWVLSFGVDLPFAPDSLDWFIPLMILLFFLGEPMLFLVGYVATDTAKHKSLRRGLFTMFAYWPLASFAAFKALYEIAFAPAFWDKTEHGLVDAEYADEIANLTPVKEDSDEYVQGVLDVLALKKTGTIS
ncbi:glycosyl transferase [Amylibacter marinus]|uniref:Glycosyl transferase n=1 Tax=Amylibacter marinus TaxID=1475483 RepID=A0ABQ5VT58_9RHOB|nr:glycosyltransferase family 2 protein [Amylibacter marinus]GLQ34561.1 glycosyl transferase [Amylibacter marinus]